MKIKRSNNQLITIAVIGSDEKAKTITKKYLNDSSSEILNRTNYEKYQVDLIACIKTFNIDNPVKFRQFLFILFLFNFILKEFEFFILDF